MAKKFALTAAQRASVVILQEEIDARAIMNIARAANRAEGRIFFALCNVFTRNWSASLSKKTMILHVTAELNGDEGLDFGHDFNLLLTRMVSNGYLRSRISAGQRLWEIAY